MPSVTAAALATGTNMITVVSPAAGLIVSGLRRAKIVEDSLR